MDIEQIFSHLQETRLIQSLSLECNLIFLGDELTLSYLRNKIELPDLSSQQQNYYYYCWSNPKDKNKLVRFLKDLPELEKYTIIVATVNNEHVIYRQIKKRISNHKLNIKALKLFSDVLINTLSHQKTILQTAETEFIAPNLSYAIISVPRSGSTLLCNLLRSTDLAGLPAEHLRDHAAILARNCRFNPIRYMKITMTHNTTANGVFGTKIISHFLATYRRKDLNIDAFLNQHFSKYIFLIREDKVAQAVSIFLAQKTAIYHIFNNEEKQKYHKKLEEINLDDIDLKEIDKRYNFICQQEKYLEKFCQDNKIEPLIIKYEELVEKPYKHISDILNYLGIKKHKVDLNIQTNLKKTQSSLSTQIIQKFKDNYQIK